MPPKIRAGVRTAGRQEPKPSQAPVRIEGTGDDSDDEYQEPQFVYKVPADQLVLTEEQRKEIIPRLLTAANPNMSRTITRFSHSEGMYTLESSVDHLAVHFAMDGELIHAGSDEAREQLNFAPSHDRHDSMDRKNATTQFEAEALESAEASITGKLLRNQFNFSERATQTFNNPHRDRKVSTEPPPTEDFSSSVTHWEIFDTYLEDLDRNAAARAIKPKVLAEPLLPLVHSSIQLGKEDEKESAPTAQVAAATKAGPVDLLKSDKLAKTLRLMERLVNQNAEYDLFYKFKYFEDKDEHSRADGLGSCTPLWRFAYDRAKKKTVTGIAWNPKFTDLFAVSYGSYDFLKQGSGLIGCFSLKNTSYPEYTFTTESGVMCVDWHPDHPALLAAGLYDGTVCVYDVRSKSNTPLYVSSNPKVKHTDPVWQVRWAREEPGKNINFYSISSDGRVTNWIMNKNELINEEVVQIKLMGKKDEGARDNADSTVGGLAGGSCFDFNRFEDSTFVVGTEEGSLHAYSKAFHTQHLRTFQGHNMACYAVKWNPFHKRVFLSCSADWSVKLWEQGTTAPIMTFDLNTVVSDIAWAPYSSTVFAVITNDVLRVYDLSVKKHDYICLEQPNRLRKEDAKAKMTHIAFNPKEPIIVIGDDRGVIRTFKLGPNLRKMSAPKLEEVSVAEEQAKLERLLIIPEKSAESEALNSLNLLGPLPPIPVKAHGAGSLPVVTA